MHLDEGSLNSEYSRYIGRKTGFIILALLMLGFLILYSISKGAADIPFIEAARALAGTAEFNRFSIIVRRIRLPQVLAATIAGGGLRCRFGRDDIGYGDHGQFQCGRDYHFPPVYYHRYGISMLPAGIIFYCCHSQDARGFTGIHDSGGCGSGGAVYSRDHVPAVFRR